MMTTETMQTIYYAHSAAHKYIVGFDYHGRLYYTLFADAIDSELVQFGRASSKRGGYAKLRVRLNKAAKLALIEAGRAVEIGGTELLDYEDQYNKGEHFERLITERLTGSTWVKDSVPFNVAGDITVDGVEVQIKYDGAELTNERVLARLAAA